MRALINAIQRALEFIHSWVADGFRWAHMEWMVPLLDRTLAAAKKLTWFYGGAVALLGLFLQSVWDAEALFLDAILTIGRMVDGADTTFQSSTALQLHAAYALANFMLPVNELFTYLIFFVGLKSIVSVSRFMIKLYELVPFKAS